MRIRTTVRRPKATKVMVVLAPRAKHEHEDKQHWIKVGFATVLPDGNILITVHATPLMWDGRLKLVPMDPLRDKKD